MTLVNSKSSTGTHNCEASPLEQQPLESRPVVALIAFVAVVLGLEVASIGVVHAWSKRRGWGKAQQLALAAGALVTYAWTAFPQTPMVSATPTQDLVGNAVFALAALALVSIAALATRQHLHAGDLA
jgi:hypothetical protein